MSWPAGLRRLDDYGGGGCSGDHPGVGDDPSADTRTDSCTYTRTDPSAYTRTCSYARAGSDSSSGTSAYSCACSRAGSYARTCSYARAGHSLSAFWRFDYLRDWGVYAGEWLCRADGCDGCWGECELLQPRRSGGGYGDAGVSALESYDRECADRCDDDGDE